MDSAPIVAGLQAVTKDWTRQRKAEERSAQARRRRDHMWRSRRTTLAELVGDVLPQAWAEASDNGRLPTHWRQIFYRARPLVAGLGADRPLTDVYFKSILEDHLATVGPPWDVLRGARGVFKEPHSNLVVAMSTMDVRKYFRKKAALSVPSIDVRFPTAQARHRFGAVLICEKEGFDELLQADGVPDRYDLALMSTKGISAHAARSLARDLAVPCFVLHDFDKNGFVMAAGFRFATDIGIRLADVKDWGLTPEEQDHRNPWATKLNLIHNGARPDEAEFIASGWRVELNELTGPRFVEFVEAKLQAHGVRKVIPDEETLAAAWQRARLVTRINALIDGMADDAGDGDPPADLAQQIADRMEDEPGLPWDDVIAALAESAA